MVDMKNTLGQFAFPSAPLVAPSDLLNTILFTEGKMQEEELAVTKLAGRYSAGPIADDEPTYRHLSVSVSALAV
jgi:hypothetical protein